MTANGKTGDLRDTDEAWKVLDLVNGWIKHAESKGGLALATGGVLAGLYVGLISDLVTPPWPLTILLILVGANVLAVGVFGAIAVVPRRRKRSPAESSVYYDHIARAYPNDSATQEEEFKKRFASVTSDKSALFEDLATQVWANSHIAAKKFKWSNVAVVLVVLAAVLLAITAVAVAWLPK